MKNLIQIKNPNTGKFVKIDKETLKLARKKSFGAYKNIRILEKPV